MLKVNKECFTVDKMRRGQAAPIKEVIGPFGSGKLSLKRVHRFLNFVLRNKKQTFSSQFNMQGSTNECLGHVSV